MRLYIDRSKSENSISFFFAMLEEHMGNMKNVSLVSPEKSEIILCGPTSSVAKKWLGKKKVVQRLDGIYFNSDSLRSTLSKNSDIAHIYKRAAGIIYQSQYSKNMIESFIGHCTCSNTIIFNGTELKQKHIDRVSTYFPQVQSLKNDGKKIFLASASWRPVKRLATIVEGFQKYRQKNPNTVLIIAGEDAKNLPDGIMCLGRIGHSQMLALYYLSDLLINLSFSDACPNVVIEALSAKKPILASSNQGSKEFYGGNGFIIEEPFAWDFRPISYDSMPQISSDIVCQGIEKALAAGYHNDVDVTMKTCAANYKKYLETLLPQFAPRIGRVLIKPKITRPTPRPGRPGRSK